MNKKPTAMLGRNLRAILLLISLLLVIGVICTRLGIVRPQLDSALERFSVIFAASVCVVVALTPAVMSIARGLGAIDLPGGRRIHTEPTPRWGGLPVAAGAIIALMLTAMHYMPNLQALITASCLVLAVGLIDDVQHVRAIIKLLVQLLACVVLIVDGIHVTFLPPSWGMYGVFGEWLITVVWIVGITNAINFLDGMDGLVSGLVAGTAAVYFALSMLLGEDMIMLAYCSIALLGASLAFLSYNIKPARIFLGDGGSTFLGFFLAALSIQGEWARDKPLVSFCVPILVLSVPIYDMVFTTVSRIASGKVTSFKSWLEFVGTDHLHHRLEALGLTRGRIVITIWFLNLGVGVGAVALLEATTSGAVALIVQAVCVYAVVALLEILGGQKTARQDDLSA